MIAEAIAANDPIEPLSGRTIVLPKDEASDEIAQRVIDASREHHASTYMGENSGKPGKRSANSGDTKTEEPERESSSSDDDDLPGMGTAASNA